MKRGRCYKCIKERDDDDNQPGTDDGGRKRIDANGMATK